MGSDDQYSLTIDNTWNPIKTEIPNKTTDILLRDENRHVCYANKLDCYIISFKKEPVKKYKNIQKWRNINVNFNTCIRLKRKWINFHRSSVVISKTKYGLGLNSLNPYYSFSECELVIDSSEKLMLKKNVSKMNRPTVLWCTIRSNTLLLLFKIPFINDSDDLPDPEDVPMLLKPDVCIHK